MKTRVFETEAEAAGYAAKTAASVLAKKPDALFCLAAGHSSLPFFDAIAARELDFSKTRFAELDEWMGLPPDAAGSCVSFLRINFFSRVNAESENICLFNPLTNDGEAECLRVTEQIEKWGGIDYLLLGMGLNGHLGLNEPGCDLNCRAHIEPLSKTTLEVAPKYFGGVMPPIKSGITLGLADLKKARLIHLLVLGSHKKDICGQLLSLAKSYPSIEAEVSVLPASVLLDLEHAELILDRAAAG